ncbi:MAG: hypothetical protein HQK53_07185 [Oligoflexia bacterium]|nr:hypothetical protein [Oligoflexia bacterium]
MDFNRSILMVMMFFVFLLFSTIFSIDFQAHASAAATPSALSEFSPISIPFPTDPAKVCMTFSFEKQNTINIDVDGDNNIMLADKETVSKIRKVYRQQRLDSWIIFNFKDEINYEWLAPNEIVSDIFLRRKAKITVTPSTTGGVLIDDSFYTTKSLMVFWAYMEKKQSPQIFAKMSEYERKRLMLLFDYERIAQSPQLMDEFTSFIKQAHGYFYKIHLQVKPEFHLSLVADLLSYLSSHKELADKIPAWKCTNAYNDYYQGENAHYSPTIVIYVRPSTAGREDAHRILSTVLSGLLQRYSGVSNTIAFDNVSSSAPSAAPVGAPIELFFNKKINNLFYVAGGNGDDKFYWNSEIVPLLGIGGKDVGGNLAGIFTDPDLEWVDGYMYED